MAKHEKKTPIAHNSKEFNHGNKDPKRQDTGVYVNVSKEDKERAEICVELVKDAFALLGKNTKVISYRHNHFNEKENRWERNVKIYGVRPIDDQGKSINFGLFGTELEWAFIHKQLKAQIEEREEAVKYLAGREKLLNLLKD